MFIRMEKLCNNCVATEFCVGILSMVIVPLIEMVFGYILPRRLKLFATSFRQGLLVTVMLFGVAGFLGTIPYL
jgi:hypothetical protein